MRAAGALVALTAALELSGQSSEAGAAIRDAGVREHVETSMREKGDAAASPALLPVTSSCGPDALACQNGGLIQATAAGGCQCLCADGYSGALCETGSRPDESTLTMIKRPDLYARAQCMGPNGVVAASASSSLAVRQPLLYGDLQNCNAKTQDQCDQFYELKERISHNHLTADGKEFDDDRLNPIGSGGTPASPGQVPPTTGTEMGHSVHGEVHLCEWSAASGCSAGAFYICALDDIVVTTARGSKRPMNGGPVAKGSHPSGYPAESPPERFEHMVTHLANAADTLTRSGETLSGLGGTHRRRAVTPPAADQTITYDRQGMATGL